MGKLSGLTEDWKGTQGGGRRRHPKKGKERGHPRTGEDTHGEGMTPGGEEGRKHPGVEKGGEGREEERQGWRSLVKLKSAEGKAGARLPTVQ